MNSIKILKAKAKDGDANAQFEMGQAFYYGDLIIEPAYSGKGMKHNFRKSKKWYEKAAKQGHIEAMTRVANAYYNGLGVSQSHPIAAYWYKKAARHGHVGAMMKVSDMYAKGEGLIQSDTMATEWYRRLGSP